MGYHGTKKRLTKLTKIIESCYFLCPVPPRPGAFSWWGSLNCTMRKYDLFLNQFMNITWYLWNFESIFSACPCQWLSLSPCPFPCPSMLIFFSSVNDDVFWWCWYWLMLMLMSMLPEHGHGHWYKNWHGYGHGHGHWVQILNIYKATLFFKDSDVRYRI